MTVSISANIDTPSSHSLLERAIRFESLLTKHDNSVLASLLSPKVTLHQDAISLQKDLEGAEAVKGYYQSYERHFDFKHTVLDVGLNEATKSVFVLSVETGVKPKGGGEQEPSSSAGVFKYVFDDEGKVTDIYFIRQLGNEELKRKTEGKKLTNMGGVSWEAQDLIKEFAGEAIADGKLVDVTPADPDRVKQVHSAAVKYSNLYTNSGLNSGVFDEIFEPNVSSTDFLFGGEKRGLEEIKQGVKTVSKSFDSTKHEHDIAISPDANKAFIHWSNKGTLKLGDEAASKDNLKGFTVLCFAPAGKIQSVLGFRQPSSKERESIFGEKASKA